MATFKPLSYIQEMPQKFLEVSEPSTKKVLTSPVPPINQNLKHSGSKKEMRAFGWTQRVMM